MVLNMTRYKPPSRRQVASTRQKHAARGVSQSTEPGYVKWRDRKLEDLPEWLNRSLFGLLVATSPPDMRHRAQIADETLREAGLIEYDQRFTRGPKGWFRKLSNLRIVEEKAEGKLRFVTVESEDVTGDYEQLQIHRDLIAPMRIFAVKADVRRELDIEKARLAKAERDAKKSVKLDVTIERKYPDGMDSLSNIMKAAGFTDRKKGVELLVDIGVAEMRDGPSGKPTLSPITKGVGTMRTEWHIPEGKTEKDGWYIWERAAMVELFEVHIEDQLKKGNTNG